jgi:5-methyltetrahydrofolate--homocysteine methyltransferase
VSNIAFGFRGNDAVRRGFHSAFLHHACKVQHDTSLACGKPSRTVYTSSALLSCWLLVSVAETVTADTDCSLPSSVVSGLLQAGMDMGIVNAQHCIADAYEKLDRELLGFIEDVLLNRCENSTERMMEYAATIDPKSKPTAVRKLGAQRAAADLTPSNLYQCHGAMFPTGHTVIRCCQLHIA